MNREMLKEAIAEAKTIKETAIASAKAALEEAFAPQLTAMFAERLNEMDEEEGAKNENYDSDKEFSLEEILAELGNAEDDSEMKKEGTYETLDEDLVLEDMSDEDIEELVTSVIDDMIASGKLMAGEESEEEEMDMDDMEDMGDMEDIDMDIDMEDGEEEIEDEEEIEIDEILAEILGEEKKEVEEGADIPADEYVTGTQMGGVATGLALGVAGLAWSSLDKKQREELITNAKAALQRYGDDMVSAFKWVKDKAKGIAGLDETADVKEMGDTINELRNELNEVNLLNAKLLYTNKIFKAKNLTESEKVKVLNTFDKAETVKEVKLVFETLTESFKTTNKKTAIKESLGSASRSIAPATPKQPIIEVNDAFARMQRLAGIKK
jgi:hypothetical protein